MTGKHVAKIQIYAFYKRGREVEDKNIMKGQQKGGKEAKEGRKEGGGWKEEGRTKWNSENKRQSLQSARDGTAKKTPLHTHRVAITFTVSLAIPVAAARSSLVKRKVCYWIHE